MPKTLKTAVPSRFKRTFFSVFCGRGVTALRQLLLVSILIRAWGVEYYGAWLVLSAIPSFLSFSNLGLGTSASLKIAVDVVAGRDEEAWTTLVTAALMIVTIGVFIVMGAAIWMYWGHGQSLTSGKIQATPVVAILLLTTLFVEMLNQPLLGWWVGRGKPSVGIHYLNAYSLGDLAICLVIPVCGGRALILSLILFLWSIVFIAFVSVKTFALTKQSESAYPRIVAPDLNLAKRLAGTGLGHQLSPLWQATFFQGSLILANSVLGPAGAALWGSLRAATRSGNQALELVSQSIGPEFQLAYGVNDFPKLRRLHSVGLVSAFIMSTGIACGLLVAGPYLFGIWTHHVFMVPRSVWWLMSIGLIPFSLWWVSGEFQRSINRPWFLNVLALFAAILSLGCMFAGARWGLVSFAIGSVIFDVCMAICILPKTLQLLGDGLGPAFKRGCSILLDRIWSSGGGRYRKFLADSSHRTDAII